MAERTFEDFGSSFDLFLNYVESKAAFLAVDERGTFSFLRLAENDIFTMTQGAFVDFRVAVDVLLDQNKFKAAFLAVNERRTGFVFHFASVGN